MDLFSSVPLFSSVATLGALGAHSGAHLAHTLSITIYDRPAVVRLYLDYSFEMAIEAAVKAI